MHNLNSLERSVHCAGCEKAIQERFLLNVLGRAWHAGCVQCVDCGSPLTDKCFSRDGKLFCRDDFFRRFGQKCSGCAQGISPNDLVRKARGNFFHIRCFTCMVCQKQLSTGEELYVLDENKFICKEDYLNSKYSQVSDDENDDDVIDKLDDNLSDKNSSYHDDDDSIDSVFPALGLTHAPSGLSLDLHPNIVKDDLHKNLGPANMRIKEEQLDKTMLDSNDNPKTDSILDKENKSESGSKGTDGKDCSDDEKSGKGGGAKRRGPRTTIKAKQLETLKAAFAATPKPTRHIREQLAQETGLNMRVIQVWFQNRRSKERRMKQLSALGARRAFFRNPRRMRHGIPDDAQELMGQHGLHYFPDGDFYPAPGFPGGYPPGEFPFQADGNLAFLPPNSGPQGHHMMDAMTGHMGPDGFGMPPADMLPVSSSGPPQEGVPPPMQPLDAFSNSLPPRSNSNSFQNNGPAELTNSDTWL